MRYRMLFGLPFACLAFAAALTFFAAPSPRLDFGIGLAAASYQVPDLALSAVDVDHLVLMAEDVPVDKPGDAHLSAYTVANQPLAAWRIASDMAHRHIDPHIAIG